MKIIASLVLFVGLLLCIHQPAQAQQYYRINGSKCEITRQGSGQVFSDLASCQKNLPSATTGSTGSSGGGTGSVDFSKPQGLVNPALDGDLGNNAEAAGDGTLFTRIFNGVLQFIMIIAFLLVLVNLIQAGINWIGSGGDSSKIQKSRDQLLQAVIGMLVLAATLAVWRILGEFLGITLSFSSVFIR